jgi:ABC-type phosphate transport system auxiliary subunit
MVVLKTKLLEKEKELSTAKSSQQERDNLAAELQRIQERTDALPAEIEAMQEQSKQLVMLNSEKAKQVEVSHKRNCFRIWST